MLSPMTPAVIMIVSVGPHLKGARMNTSRRQHGFGWTSVASGWPFEDQFFDFAICSHTLEDVRDPLHVCAELQRVAKAGYIEVPSRVKETCLGHERWNQAGLSHHRWLIEIAGATTCRFCLSITSSTAADASISQRASGLTLQPEQTVTWLWWNKTFTFEERTIHGIEEQERELEQFVSRFAICPRWRMASEAATAAAAALSQRLLNRGRRLFSR